MGQFINMVGDVFGRWTVLKIAESNNKSHHVHWLCRCECGKEKVVSGASLRRGDSQSCGCLFRDLNALSLGLANFNRLYEAYKHNAEKRYLCFELTKEDFSFLTKMNCHYCGGEPSQVKGTSYRSNGDYVYNGIDRIDNTKGYTTDNVVPCCKLCNYMKRSMEVSEFIKHVKKIANYR